MKFQEIFKSFSPKRVEKSSGGGLRTVAINPSSYLASFLTGSDILPAQAFVFYRKNSAISTAVNWIAESFEQIEPVLASKDKTLTDDAEIIQFLKNPNGFQTWQEFAGQFSRHYLLTHNIFFQAIGNVNFSPSELYALHPGLIQIYADTKDGFPASYQYSSGDASYLFERTRVKRDMRFYSGPMQELFQIAGFSSRPYNTWGDSPLTALALEAKQQIQGRIHNLQMLENGGRLSLIVSFKDEYLIPDDEHIQRKTRIIEDLGGSGNAGAIAVISGAEVDVNEVGKSNKDMDYAELDRVASNAIYLSYKVPLPLVTTDTATYNNMRTAIEYLYDFAVLPHAKKLFAGLSKFLLPRFKIDPNKFKITYNPDSITALIARKLEELKMRKDIAVETINELRDGLPDRQDIEGGDTLYQPANLVPVGTDIMDTGDLTPGRERGDDDE